MSNWLKDTKKESVQMGKYLMLGSALFIPILLTYWYFTKEPGARAAMNERQLYIVCLAGAMVVGTILLTVLHDLRWESSRPKYWPVLAFYGSNVLMWKEGVHDVAIVLGVTMTAALLFMKLDDYLAAKGWGSKPEPLKSPTHDELP
ncbi:MAG: hypothetical protein HYZ07_01230 [Candidatus Harrisonbacteria bacterium]|nr:hypothetical protein [Candidatus Harrisonbacteria bacterium]